MRYLGIDYGTKRVGVALSDEAGTMGFPHAVFPNDKQLLPAALALIREKNVGGVVIGASLTLAGEKNPVAHAAESLGEALRAAGVPVFFESEWLTTQEARRAPEGERMHKNEMTDASAAALILTSFLSHHDNH